MAAEERLQEKRYKTTKLLTGTKIVVGVVGIVQVHIHLVVVAVPIHARYVAIDMTRTRLFA